MIKNKFILQSKYVFLNIFRAHVLNSMLNINHINRALYIENISDPNSVNNYVSGYRFIDPHL